ncbi:hypothetical protein acsn021_17110 [Anaerocolumna cellulosilytica]|uniref:Uncharacterized protein n=1 Tax=Anaerocolumna cellulosilytica TaxID=433286 RepID=A0A6S6R3R9_9FIRM|nr:hypothetical protein [Anaerocolumna cellulosilytica]MBB5194895.1 hypothetical protein [Anaerocolumna cellulosilytica]BCJ94142.1 hypothetical protein acsn021_17110 [Anaerocolumna cellulosilytica]
MKSNIKNERNSDYLMLKEDISIPIYPTKKIIDIKAQKKYNTILQIAYPLCVALREEKLIPWIYENYMKICGFEAKHDRYGMNYDIYIYDNLCYAKTDFIDNRILNYSYIDLNTINSINNINDLIYRKISDDFNIIVLLDEYYIKGRDAFQSFHSRHEFLIYGYDLEDELFYLVGFYDKIFTKFTITFESFYLGLASKDGFNNELSWLYDRVMMFAKPVKPVEEYPFDIKIFSDKLNHYIDGTHDEKDTYYINLLLDDSEKKMYYGINVYLVLDNYLKDLTQRIYLIDDEDLKHALYFISDRYKMFHCFMEYKKGLLERLYYLVEQFKVSEEYILCVTRYSEIVDVFASLCNKYIKLTLRLKDYPYANFRKYFSDIMNEIKEVSNSCYMKEKVILKEIYHYIYNFNNSKVCGSEKTDV